METLLAQDCKHGRDLDPSLEIDDLVDILTWRRWNVGHLGGSWDQLHHTEGIRSPAKVERNLGFGALGANTRRIDR